MGRTFADELAKKQKEISVSEFFERNKHILGFDSFNRALITSVKEAVDNALDACEEARILPEIRVELRREGQPRGATKTEEMTMIVEDNGPGIVKKQVGNIFARLLYGSRFHAIRQSRGQQGIGISATVMYGQLTTGKPAVVLTKTGPRQPALLTHLKLDTRHNQPDLVKQAEVFSEALEKSEDLRHWVDKASGTRVEVSMEVKYQRGPQSVFEYLRSTAIVNPHARITFKEPDGTVTEFDRATDILPEPTQEIKPHPEGIELGTLLKMAKHTTANTLGPFLQQEFSRVSAEKAKEIADKAGLGTRTKMAGFELAQAKSLIDAFQNVKLLAPPTDCLSPIGEVLVRKGLKKELPETEFITTVTRPANVYSGRPFVVEVGLAYGGGLPRDEQARVIRFANRVPLLYQKGACVSTQAVESVDWRRYEMEQRGGRGIPIGPVVILVHVASVNVPFTSEAKEAIADIDVIKNEVVLALREVGRKMGSHVRKKAKLAKMREKEGAIRKLIPKIAEKSATMLGKPVPDWEPIVARIMNNMMITDQIVPLDKGKGLRVHIDVTNYCNFGKTFSLYSAFPHGVAVADVAPAPEKSEDGLLQWKVKRIPVAGTERFSYTLQDLEPSDYDETDLYVKGIEEDIVIGAEAWKGKEDLERIEIETVRTITSKGEVIEGILAHEEDAPRTADQEEDVEVEKAESKRASERAKEVELAARDARPRKTKATKATKAAKAGARKAGKAAPAKASRSARKPAGKKATRGKARKGGKR